MKTVSALVLALCIFAFPLAASPAADCPAAPAMSVPALAGTPDPIQNGPVGQPGWQYCWDMDRTYCSPVGSTRNCTDGIWSDYVCTCRYDSYYRTNYWDCPEVR